MSNASSDAPIAKTTGPRNESWVAPVSLLGVIVVFFAAQIVGGLVLYQYGSLRGWSSNAINDWLNNSTAAQFVFLVISESLVLAGIFGLMRLLHWTRRTIGLTKPKLQHILIGLAAVVPYYALYLVIVTIAAHIFPSFNIDQKQDIGFNNVTGHMQLLLTFLSLVIVPPLVEEIVMRGFLYSGLRTWLPKIASALLVSIVFGAAHLSEGGSAGPLWVGALDTFSLSLLLVGLRELTGSLWAGITLHMLKNGIAFVLLFLVGTN